MATLFLFGTLQYGELLKAVLPKTSHLITKSAKAVGYSVSPVSRGASATLVETARSHAKGTMVTGLTDEDMAALTYYCDAVGDVRTIVKLDAGEDATAFVSEEMPEQAGAPWVLDDWVQAWGELTVLTAREVLHYRQEKSTQDIRLMLPMIRARAWSRINASNSQHGAGTLHGEVALHHQRRPYANYFALDEYELQHERFDGTLSEPVKRAVFLAADAALVLPYDPKRDRVMVVEQMRMGPMARGDRSMWQLEPIAGRLDPGEDAETAVRREALEEAGLTLGDLETVAEAYSSPGTSNEFYYVFVGLADLPDNSAGVGGLDAEDEDIRSHILSFDELMTMCDNLDVGNSPLVMAAYWLARHRERLRDSTAQR